MMSRYKLIIFINVRKRKSYLSKPKENILVEISKSLLSNNESYVQTSSRIVVVKEIEVWDEAHPMYTSEHETKLPTAAQKQKQKIFPSPPLWKELFHFRYKINLGKKS